MLSCYSLPYNTAEFAFLLPTDPMLPLQLSPFLGASIVPSQVLPQQSAAIETLDGQVQALSHSNMLPNVQKSSIKTPSLVQGELKSYASSRHVATTNVGERGSYHSNGALEVLPDASLLQLSVLQKLIESETAKKEFSVSTAGRRENGAECALGLTSKKARVSLGSGLTSDEENEKIEFSPPSHVSHTQLSTGASLNTSKTFENVLKSSSRKISVSKDLILNKSNRCSTPSSAADPSLPCPSLSPPSLSTPSLSSSSLPSPQENIRISLRNFTSDLNSSTSASFAPLAQSNVGLPQSLSPLTGGLDGPNNLLSNLQHHKTVQSLHPEKLMRLPNEITQSPTLPPALPAAGKQGKTWCNECNINFKREENYVVHQNLYCASRHKTNVDGRSVEDHNMNILKKKNGLKKNGLKKNGLKKNSDFNSSVFPSTLMLELEAQTNSTSGGKDASPSSNSTKPSGPFVCSSCWLDCMSRDYLLIHQMYYCPNRKEESVEERVNKDMWRCPRCRVAMPETMQVAHQCANPENLLGEFLLHLSRFFLYIFISVFV